MLTYLTSLFQTSVPEQPLPRNPPVQRLGRCEPRRSGPWPSDRLLSRPHTGIYIYGFPSKDKREGYFCLLKPSPAFFIYIMGPGWRQHLQRRTTAEGVTEDYIPRPGSPMEVEGVAGANEKRHYFLMRRCGAVRTYSYLDIVE